MYMPYLYGRQYELLAIRMMLEDQRDRAGLLPLVEPLMAKTRDLTRCISLCGDHDQSLAVVVNPDKHELKNAAALERWLDETTEVFNEERHVIPTLVCRTDSVREIVEPFLEHYPDRALALVHPGKKLSPSDMAWLARKHAVRWHIVAVDHVPQARWQQLPSDRVILLKDCFNKMERNADYGEAEFFTNRHHSVPNQVAGLSDYLCIGSHFKDGGSTPHAVAIHAAYKDPDDHDVWIEHFVSTHITKDEGDVASKFVDAARKLTRAVRGRPSEFGDNQALREFGRLARAAVFPGLPTSKKLQMVHHMCLMMDVLEGRL